MRIQKYIDLLTILRLILSSTLQLISLIDTLHEENHPKLQNHTPEINIEHYLV